MKRSLLVLLLLWLVVDGSRGFAADGTVGRIKTASAPAYVMRGTETIAATAGMHVVRSDTLVTGKQGSMGVVFNDNATLALGADTKLQLALYEFNVEEKKAGFVARLRRGTIVYLSGLIARMNADATRFETPVAVAGIKGTKLAIKVDGGDGE
ncbi:MAG TPA: FecR domain-containing protein [Desulfuromonadaceae bacterium]